jgi:hypothetical protein
MHRIVLFAGLALASLAATVHAANAPEPYIEPSKVEPANFPRLVATLTGEMQPGGRFEELSPTERAAVERELALIGRRLEGHASIDTLDEAARIEVFNAQERANAILARRDGQRLVCERRARIGSNRRELYCETVAERRARSDDSKRRARELDRRVQQCDDSGRCVSG